MTHFNRVVLINPTQSKVQEEIDKFTSAHDSNFSLHDVAKRNLLENSVDFTDPFPRVESHGRYLFGEFATPTSLVDGKDLFLTVHFVVSFDYGLVIFRSPDEGSIEKDSRLTQNDPVKLAELPESGGQFILDLIEYIVLDYEEKIAEVHERIDDDLLTITNQFDNHRKNVTKIDISKYYNSASLFNIDILGCKSSIEGMLQVLSEIASDNIDLKISNETGVLEMFTQELEIEMSDLHIRMRHLKSLRNNLQETLKITFKKFEKIEELRQTRASHNMTAITSIMLLPSFLVGFFGQNFKVSDELNFHSGWLVSLGLIIAVSITQIIFFRRKNWL